MQAGSSEAQRYTLGLLLAGLSPEEAERHLEGRLVQQSPRTALTDPTNVLMQEVTVMAQPSENTVAIMGVTTRTNNSPHRRCTACRSPIPLGAQYERVARLPGAPDPIESYDITCFIEEFGSRGAFGE